MSALSDKINSYALNRGIAFEEAFSTTPTRTGNNPLISAFTKNTGTSTIYESFGPLGGNGSWNMPISTTSANNGYLRAPTSGTTELANVSDGDYSVGIWFKINSMPGGTSNIAIPLLTFGSTSSLGFGSYISGSTAANPSRLVITSNSVNYFSPSQIQGGTWYYLAVVRAGNTGTNMTAFLNGTQIASFSNTNTGFSQTWMLGNTSANAAGVNGSWNFSNYYLTDSATINSTQIGEIWTTGSTAGATNVTINETPATASADQVDATIVVSGGSFTEITTSILVDAIFPDNIAVLTESNLNLEITGTLDASVEIGDNIIAGGDRSTSFDAAEFIASADLAAPRMINTLEANAQMVDPTIFVTPNFYSMVKAKNPVFYTDYASATPSNLGSWTGLTYTVGNGIATNVDSGGSLSLVSNGKSWKGNSTATSANNYLNVLLPNYDMLYDIASSRDYAVEAWFKGDLDNNGILIDLGIFEFDAYNLRLTTRNRAQLTYDASTSVTENLYSGYNKPDLFVNNDWNQVFLNIKPTTGAGTDYYGNSYNQYTFNLSINGSFITSKTVTFRNAVVYNINNVRVSALNEVTNFGKLTFLDETAIYPQSFTNSQILDHYSFVSSLDPDKTIYATPCTASAVSGNHAFVVTSNAIPEIKEATAQANIVEPLILGGKSINPIADIAESSVDIVQPSVSYDFVIDAAALAAYSESVNAFALNTMYFDYVQSNIAPYRYVTFDATNSYSDYGSDNDYSVAPVTGGTVVSPQFGINGKSAKIDGTTYTDGVVLKESEWDDTWGTGQNTYHSSFWMQKAEDDNSTGLRVLWNLNGYLDNQHVVLFQYQGKLHMQFNNGSGTHLDAVTTNNIDLFDGQRHFVVIAFDHTNNNDNKVHLYVDSVLVLTATLGSYNGTTVNGTSYVGPNDEANNHPRLGIGCLITPFAETALPVVPTNIKIYVDEIVWAKSAATQNVVNGLYAAMPDKQNELVTTEEMHADSAMVDPAVSTEAILTVDSLTAGIIITDAEISADREIIAPASAMVAEVTFPEALRSDEVNVVADVAVASAFTIDGVVKITIPGGPMTMEMKLIEPSVNGYALNLTLSAWARYLRATDVNTLSLQRGVN